MRSILGVLSGLWLTTAITGAQAAEEVRILVSAFEVATYGGERSAVSFSTDAVAIGKQNSGVIAMIGCGRLSVRPAGPFRDNVTTGWTVDITPVRVVDHATTFRLRWVRALDQGKAVSAQSEDVEVTLRPGETRPLDSVPVPSIAAKPIDGRPCGVSAVSLRVSADFPGFDRRLIGADVWLVERLANGREQSQALSVRGLPHRPVPFYFDSVPDGPRRFDFFGKLVAEPESGGLKIALETTWAVPDPGQNGYQAARWFRSTLHLKPEETVEVALREDDIKGGALAKRSFSLRIRARLIRLP